MPRSVWPVSARPEPIPSERRLAAMQPVSWSRLLVRYGISWLVMLSLIIGGEEVLESSVIAAALSDEEKRRAAEAARA